MAAAGVGRQGYKSQDLDLTKPDMSSPADVTKTARNPVHGIVHQQGVAQSRRSHWTRAANYFRPSIIITARRTQHAVLLPMTT